MKKLTKKNIFTIVFLAAAAILPFIITNSYTLRILTNVCIYSIISLSINLIVGFSGQLDFGRAAFVGLGAYCSAILVTTLHMPFIVGLIGGGLFAALFGAVLGWICRHSSFDYLTLITVGFLEICRKIFQNWYAVTNGSFGFRTEKPSFFGVELKSPRSLYWLCLIILILCYIAIYRITKSKMGRAYMALRDDPIAAEYAGINVKAFKLNNFVIASFFSGIAGSLMAHFTTFLSPTVFVYDEALLELQMAILGGLGSLPGSILGAAILTILPEVSRAAYEYRLLIMGIMMVVLMLFVPNGLLGRDGVVDRVIALVRKMGKRTQGKKVN